VELLVGNWEGKRKENWVVGGVIGAQGRIGRIPRARARVCWVCCEVIDAFLAFVGAIAGLPSSSENERSSFVPG
jgi:hypothetical protein